ncbi:hypothetical protein Tco_0427704, partial [Tanacetum coccineum]
MPIDNNKPPNPLIDELCILTKMTSADELCSASLNNTKVKVLKGKHCKAHRGIKVSTPGSTGTGSVLRCLRSAKVAGKARDRVEGSPRDDRGGKRVVSTPMNHKINKVLSDFNSGSLNNNLKFAMGCSNDDSIVACSLNEVDYDDLCKGNDGLFINLPLDSSPDIGLKNSPVTKSCGLKSSHEHTSMGDLGNTGVGIASFKDGIDIAKTGILNEKGMACSGTSYKVGNGFEFGSNEKSKGILKNPNGSLFNVQFGKNATSNPFAKKSMVPKGGAWNNNGSNALGSRILSNQFSTDVDRFAKKLKQGTEELALKMEYVLNSISKLENGNRRISFSAEEVYKGDQACSLQLYGYFVGTSMDYWVVRGNLMRMWRIFDIEDITKTNSGVYYFKFKSEEGMKKVLESSSWMIQNVSLVLNVWEPGIWLEKTKPSLILIWVCVYNVPMELCNGKMDFARVFVEVSAEEDLPNVLEIEYPPLGCRPARIGKLEVKYQWKPPLCTHCKTFGHNTLSCKIHPRTEDEIAADAIKEAIKVKNSAIVNKISDENDGFVTVGRKNKPIESRPRSAPVRNFNNKGGFFSGGQKQYDVSKANASGNGKRFSSGDFAKKNNYTNSVQGYYVRKTSSNPVTKSLYQISKDPNFKPKLLVRGSGSNNDSKCASNVSVPVHNSFNVLRDDSGDETEDISGFNVDAEFKSNDWPQLKEEVDILLEACIYPSKQVRLDWSLYQLDYFYKHYHKFHHDPIMEDDDEGDVDSDVEGIIVDMKPEVDVNPVDNMEINATVNEDVYNEDNYSFCSLLETHVKKKNLSRVCNRVLGNWDWVSNCSSYASDRRCLWKSLIIHKGVVKDRPWTILGDFNSCLDPSERSCGGYKFTTAMLDFRDCVEDIEVEDISMTGLRFTWNKKPGKDGGLLKKLDRVLGNISFMSLFPSSYAHFLPYMLSDHSPAVLVIPKIENVKSKPFKFHNYLTAKDDFIPVVKHFWSNKVKGFAMFSLGSKLKFLKKPLRKLNYDQDPHNNVLRDEELRVFKAYKSALKDEESFLMQKSKVEWLKAGDRNFKYFHNVVKGRRNRNKISYVKDMEGNSFHGNSKGEQFVRHFKIILGKSSKVLSVNDPAGLFLKKLSDVDALYMVRNVSDDEIKRALFDIDGNKAPAVKDFFSNGKLLKEVNPTVIFLVPKFATSSKVLDYRPIACCNVVYKIISKVICKRIKGSLKDLVDDNQSAFIPSRQINDNILLFQVLMRNYHRKRGPAKCAFKIDIEKAYDSVEWEFLSSCLMYFGFHEKMIKWVMSYVSSTSFTINVNGDHIGFFKGMRGLRQGDPLSPYLFTLIMEVLNLILKREIDISSSFRYHWQCKEVKLTRLCFADDLLMFCNGDSASVVVINKALMEFGGMSGLLPNIAK